MNAARKDDWPDDEERPDVGVDTPTTTRVLAIHERSEQIRKLLAAASRSVNPTEQMILYEQAHRIDLNDPMAMSYHGMALATMKGAYLQGIVFCEEAVRRVGPNPELLVNLAKAYTAANSKREAVRCLRRALSRSGGVHSGALRELLKLGLRRPPVIPFLPRSFFLNKWLGKLRHRLFYAKQQHDDGRLPVPAELGHLSGDVQVAQRALGSGDVGDEL